MGRARQISGFSLGIAGAVAFAVMGAFAKVASPNAPPSLILFSRGLLAVLILIPATFSELSTPKDRAMWSLALRAIAGATAIYCYYWTLSRSTLAPSQALASFSPALVAVLAMLQGGERVSTGNCFAISLIVAGAGLFPMFSTTSGLTIPVIAIGFLGSIFGGVAFSALGVAAHRFSPMSIACALGAAMILVSFAVHDASWRIPPANTIVWIFGAAIAALIGQLLMTASFGRIEPSAATALSMMSIPLSRLMQERVRIAMRVNKKIAVQTTAREFSLDYAEKKLPETLGTPHWS